MFTPKCPLRVQISQGLGPFSQIGLLKTGRGLSRVLSIKHGSRYVLLLLLISMFTIMCYLHYYYYIMNIVIIIIIIIIMAHGTQRSMNFQEPWLSLASEREFSGAVAFPCFGSGVGRFSTFREGGCSGNRV